MIACLHGFTGAPGMWQDFECVALPLLGHSTEVRARGGESFRDEVERLAAALPESCEHLVGYSLGGRLALAIASHHPGRVGKLTLIGASPGLSSAQEREERQKVDRIWIEGLREKGIEHFVDAWESLPLWRSQGRLPEAIRAQQRATRLAHDPLQLAFALEALGTGAMPSLWQSLSKLRVPVTLVVGSLDTKYLQIASNMMALLPGAHLAVIDDAGHNPVLETPAGLRDLL